MSKRRNTYRYELKDGRQVVYVGVTEDPERRVVQHREDGKRFSHLNVAGPRVKKESAEIWEESRLKQYRQNHGGKNPKYNKTDR